MNIILHISFINLTLEMILRAAGMRLCFIVTPLKNFIHRQFLQITASAAVASLKINERPARVADSHIKATRCCMRRQRKRVRESKTGKGKFNLSLQFDSLIICVYSVEN